MVGGKVVKISVCDTGSHHGHVLIKVEEDTETCCIYVKNERYDGEHLVSDAMCLGDTVWWQQDAALWTSPSLDFEDKRLEKIGWSFKGDKLL